jgi:glycosyltransferase involved in cell wall biosynthesis
MQAKLFSGLFGTASPSMRQNFFKKLGLYTVARESYPYDLSIVIVSYNTKDLLRECLHSVEREAAGLSKELLLVDNNSTDSSPRRVEIEFPHVKLIRSTINLGFGAANNLALESAQARYIVLLNSDALAWLAKWLDVVLYRVSGLRNRFSSDPVRQARSRARWNLAQAMQSARIETEGGRKSPPRPW